jgi:hypothetical protein
LQVPLDGGDEWADPGELKSEGEAREEEARDNPCGTA